MNADNCKATMTVRKTEIVRLKCQLSCMNETKQLNSLYRSASFAKNKKQTLNLE